ncbi:unnamed protein product [Periconia digitata]|uniref:Uncharacterized protein n=1 Tax=Periconia digitata TaxID=1303443 RepID=A0A9W4XPK2_9PLEO|nr:unnamed protein product [Periconia digitata]
MDSFKALAIFAFCTSVNAAALPQSLPLSTATGTAATVGPAAASGAAGVAISKPILPAAPAVALPGGIGLPALPLGKVPAPDLKGLPLPQSGSPLDKVPAVGNLPLEVPAAPKPEISAPTEPKLPIGGDLPKLPVLGDAAANLPLPDSGSLPVSVPASPSVDGLPFMKLPSADGLPIPKTPLPNTGSLSLPDAPGLPSVDGIPIPKLPLPDTGSLPKLPLPDTDSLPLPVPLPKLPNLNEADALDKVVKLGSTVLEVILGILAKGTSLFPLPGGIGLPSTPSLPIPNASLPLQKRQLGGVGGLLSGAAPLASPAAALGTVTGSGAASGLTGTVANAAGSVPVVGGVTGGANPVSGALGTVASAGGSVPIAGSAAAPIVNTVGGAAGSVGGATGALAPITNAASGVANTVSSAAGGLPIAGPPVSGAVNSIPAPLSPPLPNSEPLGAFSIAIVATLLSLLKKDPLSLFAPSLPVRALVKRDLPELHAAGIPELHVAKRQLPSLSTGSPVGGIGNLPLGSVTGISPDLAFLVSSIAKNIALPGGTGVGSITSNILGILNGVVPNFLFQLPVVQDAVPTFGVLQLLSSINPTKFGNLVGLTSLASLQQAVGGITSTDLAFVKGLPLPSDPTNLISTITNLSDNILTLPGNVVNLKASVAALCLKNLGLAVPGL